MARLMSELYTQQSNLLTCPQMQGIKQKDFKQIINRQASEVGLKSALKNLTEYLHTYYQVKAIILIDE